ncbi:unnamed protein product [Sphacelaria rigidula]
MSCAIGLASIAAERSSTRRGRKGVGARSPVRRRAVPWDNRTPFVRTEMSPFREASAPTLRASTANSPAFTGGAPSRRNHRPRSSCSTSRRVATARDAGGVGLDRVMLVEGSSPLPTNIVAYSSSI